MSRKYMSNQHGANWEAVTELFVVHGVENHIRTLFYWFSFYRKKYRIYFQSLPFVFGVMERKTVVVYINLLTYLRFPLQLCYIKQKVASSNFTDWSSTFQIFWDFHTNYDWNVTTRFYALCREEQMTKRDNYTNQIWIWTWNDVY